MLTPQEMQEKKFTKAVFGGYDMREVDDFLDTVTADYERLYKENAILKGKLKTLADKVEEYRASDDDMRRTFAEAKRAAEDALASAKHESAELLSSAKKEREELLSSARKERENLIEDAKKLVDSAQRDAQEKAKQQIGALGEEIEGEKRRLEQVKEQCMDYVREVEKMLAAQAELLRAFVNHEDKPTPQQDKVQPAQKSDAGDEPTIEFRTDDAPVTADSAGEKSASEENPEAAVQSAAALAGGDDSFFASAREVNIGGRNIKVFDARQRNVFEDIFREEQ